MYSNHVYKTNDITGNELSETDFMGMSAIIGPEGAEIARANCSETAEYDRPKHMTMKFDRVAQSYANVKTIKFSKYSTLLISDINVDVYKDMFKSIDFLRDRRTETFHEICQVKSNLDGVDHKHRDADKTKKQKN